MESWIPSILYLNRILKELKIALLLRQASETFLNIGMPLARGFLLLFWSLIRNTGEQLHEVRPSQRYVLQFNSTT